MSFNILPVEVANMSRSDWRVRRRSYGDSFGSCLLMIVLVLGGTMWAYFHFFQNRDLVNAGEAGTFLIEKEDNRVAAIEYQRHMRERLLGLVESQVVESNTFLSNVLKKKYAGDKNGFEQRVHELENSLRESINELNARQVPQRFVKGHSQLAETHKHCYEAIKEIQQGYFEEDAKEQKKLYESARKKLNKAWGMCQSGKSEIKRNYG